MIIFCVGLIVGVIIRYTSPASVLSSGNVTLIGEDEDSLRNPPDTLLLDLHVENLTISKVYQYIFKGPRNTETIGEKELEDKVLYEFITSFVAYDGVGTNGNI